MPVCLRPEHCAATSVQVKPRPATLLTLTFGLVVIAARYKSPGTPVIAVDVDAVRELVEPPLTTSSNTTCPLPAGTSSPVPLSATSRGFSSGSSLAMLKAAVLNPVDVGLKLTTTSCVPPGATVNGAPPLSMLNSPASPPVMLVPLTFKSAWPVLPTTNVWLALVPSNTLP